MKKKLLLVLAGIILFSFIVLTSFGWYKLFYKPVNNASGTVTNLQVILENNNNVIHEKNAVPAHDASEITPYHFTIKNKSNTASIYKVLIEDSITTDLGKSLSREQLAYELTMNGAVIRTGTLSEIKNNILDERSIEGQKENQYALKIWVREEAVNTTWQDKSYSYKINIQTEEQK